MLKLTELLCYCDELLACKNFTDYAPNGLQIFGSETVGKLVTGVSANMQLIDAAINANAGTILVHHGFFWRGEAPELIGIKGARIGKIMRHNLNLIGYHLPLDAHNIYGNNAVLGKLLGLQVSEVIGTGSAKNLLYISELATPITIDELESRVGQSLARAPFKIVVNAKAIKRVAWCTGAAQDFIDQAAKAGADVYLSGEISERTTHEAIEYGINYFAIGHHASERGGVQALGELLAREFAIEHEFIDIENPV